MNGTEKQIEYAKALMGQFEEGIAAWKAMMPAGHPGIPALTARIDAAKAKAETLSAGRVIDILKGRRSDQSEGQGLAKWTAFMVKLIEEVR